MEMPSYFLSRPEYTLEPEKQAAFEALWLLARENHFIDYELPYSKWQFLSYLCESKELVLHGSQNLEIDVVEPRQANDKREYSNQKAIYATTDGIWVMYFAIIDRRGHPGLSLFNSCFQIKTAEQQLSEPYYFFSISRSYRKENPWCQGAIYILPRQNFTREASEEMEGAEIIFPHWISSLATRPKGKLMVGPEDFPFLEQIQGHNDQKLVELYTANPEAFPIEAVES